MFISVLISLATYFFVYFLYLFTYLLVWCLFLYLFAYLLIYLFIYVFMYLFTYLLVWCLYLYLFINLCLCLFMSVCICLPTYLFVWFRSVMERARAHHDWDVSVTRHFRDLWGRSVISCGSNLLRTATEPTSVLPMRQVGTLCLCLSPSLSPPLSLCLLPDLICSD